MTVTLTDSVRHPKIYAYTTDQYHDTVWVGGREGSGLLKVGYTTGDAERRVRQQLAGVKMPTPVDYDIKLVEAAITSAGDAFTDRDVHAVLTAAGVHRVTGEWFECTPGEVAAAVESLREGSDPLVLRPKEKFGMRAEQAAAVEVTAAYFTSHADPDNPPHFLWNAKMRFGKTFTAYQLAKHLGWTRVLVLTYKPAVASAWRDDLLGHADFDGWRFYAKGDAAADLDDPSPLVWFASFQDMLGTDADGNPKVRNEDLYLEAWDVVIIDEYHFGAWRDAARSLYLADRSTGIEGDATEKAAVDNPDLDDDFTANLESSLELDVANYLYLSGTPFRALTQGEFLEDQVYNWTYGDEQDAKASWTGDGQSPYAALPEMRLLAYEMPDKLRQVALNNNSEFTFTEFFRTDRGGSTVPKFVHQIEVQRWLDLLRGQDIEGLWASVSSQVRPPLPFEDTNLLVALQHTVWYLPSVDACVAMRDLLEAPHNTFFADYEVVVAAGSHVGMGDKALDPVKATIGVAPQQTKSITLSCGKLMTGVTVPAWAGILMLRELKSPESYFQAAFRVQSPWMSKFVNTTEGGETAVIHKEHCYVLDFAPNRALRQIVDYATRLRAVVAAERDDEAAIDEFMEFLPVLSFDGFGMRQLRAADVLHMLTAGISASMLARRWNSPELLTLDLKAMEALLADADLLASLEKIEAFRNITNDLEAMISTNKELKNKSLAKDKLSKGEKARKDDAKTRRENLRKRLQRFVTRIPVFMYLTDDRERTVSDIITQVEPELFESVTQLSLGDFASLVNAGVFNDSKMNDAVWKFRTFEEPSLRYGPMAHVSLTVGGWTLVRDDRFAHLVDAGIVEAGQALVGAGGVDAVVTADYGVAVGGIRYASPDEAAVAASDGAVTDGWGFWSTSTGYGSGTLADLAELDT